MAVYNLYGGRTQRDHYETMLEALKTERASWDSQWADLADYIAPSRVRFSPSDRSNAGSKKRKQIVDSTASFAARVTASGMHSGMSSPARPWFKLTVPDKALADHKPIKEWLHSVTERMQTVFAMSNLYNALPEVYGDMATFGTGAMAVFEDARDLFRCETYPLGSYVLALDRRKKVCTFMYEFEMTVRQVVEMFGGPGGSPAVVGREIDWTTISSHVQGLWEDRHLEKPISVVWVVAPNLEANASLIGARFLPWKSCFFERASKYTDDRKLLRESGFRQFPVMAPRWAVTGNDAYGTESCGMVVLGDVRQLQTMQRKKGMALEKIINPALVGPPALRTQKTSLLAGDVTYVDEQGTAKLRPIHEIGLNFQHLTMDVQDLRQMIRRGYYEDLFLMMANSDPYSSIQPPTAREVEERHEEKLLALGPVVERTGDELHNPLIDRVYDLMERASTDAWARGEDGLLPQPPEELHGVDLSVEYISIMAQAQKLVSVVGQDRFVQTMVPLSEAFPQIRAKVNVNRLVDNYADMLGIDPRILRTDDEADAMVAEQQQAAAMQQAAATAKDAGAAAASVAQASAASGTPVPQIPIGQGDTSLNRVLSGIGA